MAIEQDNILIAVETVGTGKAAAELDAVSAAAGRLDVATTGMGTATERASRKQGWFLSQMLFTARRFAYGFTLAMVAAGAGLAALGLQYDNTMQQSQIAFTALLGNAQLAKNEVSSLFTLAAHTPFTFANILSTTRQLLAFGFSLKETNKMLPVLADTISAFGLTGDQISHLAIVFGQIHQSGRLLGQDMRQLQQAGVPVYGALRHQLHLTQAQILAFMKGQLMIPSSVGIPAIMNELNRRFHGMAAKQAKTFQGEFSTLKDYVSQFMGGAMQGLFGGLTHMADRLNKALEGIHATMSDTGAITWKTVSYIDHLVGAGGFLTLMLKQLKTAFENYWAYIVNNVWPATKFGIGLFIAVGSVILWLINTVFGPFVKNIHFIRFALEAWIAKLIVQFTWTVLTTIAQEGWNAVMWIGWGAMRAMVIMGTLWEGTLIALSIANWLLFGSELSVNAALFLFKLQVIATVAWIRIMTAAQWLLNIAMDANPVGAIILGFTLLILIFYELYQHYHNFKKALLDTLATALWFVAPFIAITLLIINHWSTVKQWFTTFFGWLEAGWNAISGIVTGIVGMISSTFMSAFSVLISMIRGAVNWIITGLNWVIHKINWATAKYNQVFGWATGNIPGIPDIPHLAQGGTVTQSGLTIIGERGPEVMFLPQGAQVQPLSRLDKGIDKRRIGTPKLQAIIPLSIDGNAIAQYTADIILTTQAGMGAL